MKLKYFYFGLFLLSFFRNITVVANPSQQPNSSEILHKIEKLNVLGSVLYFAAHPDDENTGFIAYMANEEKYQTYYLSLTRGDGGQNLIGPEMRELLGIIRTQELLQARRIDGGKQYFSRANDFGYSKNPDETLQIWDREAVLADAVWIIRNTRPDLIVTRFPPDERAGHGHHTASALLAAEAFDAAGDPTRFPEQLKYVDVWKPRRLMWNISMWAVRNREEFIKNVPNYMQLDIGKYNPLLGASYGEIAARSRSMHKSQGFGAVGRRGVDVEYFEFVKGEKPKDGLLEGINSSWSRVAGGDRIPSLIEQLKKEYDVTNPSGSVPTLLKIRREILKVKDAYWQKTKLEEVDQLIKDVLGLYLEAVSGTSIYTPGEMLTIAFEAVNRSTFPVELVSWSGPFLREEAKLNQPLNFNEAIRLEANTQVPEQQDISHPYWLTRDIGYAGMFEVADQPSIGLPENPPVAQVRVRLKIESEEIEYQIPVLYKKRDPVRGEVVEPFVISPPVYTELGNEVYMFKDGAARNIRVTVTAARENCQGTVRLRLPEGWRVTPSQKEFKIERKGGNMLIDFKVIPPGAAEVGEVIAIAEMDGVTYDRGLGIIAYDHIPRQVFFPQSKARIVRLDLKTKGELIGYIHGAGDAVPQALQEIGYQVTVLEDKDIEPSVLQRFDAVILGVRAYNTRPALSSRQSVLLDYVKGGGNLIVQYNTSMDLPFKDLGPFPFDISRERVSVEEAEVRILNPQSPVLNSPNKITLKDFEGWVQERGLYFPANWDQRYHTVISSNDPGGAPLDSGILYTKFGEGYYIYSSLSWFRELPAGVPGAYRLFVNLISLGK